MTQDTKKIKETHEKTAGKKERKRKETRNKGGEKVDREGRESKNSDEKERKADKKRTN